MYSIVSVVELQNVIMVVQLHELLEPLANSKQFLYNRGVAFWR
jgi:hypothetical protein